MKSETNVFCLFVPERECGDPEPPEGIGDVRVTGKTFGSKAIYSCPEKYRVVGMEERICQADGTWSSSPPSCKKAGNQLNFLIIHFPIAYPLASRCEAIYGKVGDRVRERERERERDWATVFLGTLLQTTVKRIAAKGAQRWDLLYSLSLLANFLEGN